VERMDAFAASGSIRIMQNEEGEWALLLFDGIAIDAIY